MEPGYLVEFFEERRLLIAVVTELKGERLHVLTQTQREMTLPRKRVLHATPGRLCPDWSRQQMLVYLEESERKRESLQAEINLEDLWELLSQENQALSLEEMATLWFQGSNPDQVAAMGRALYADRFFFKYKEGLWVPNPPSMVATLKEKARREEKERLELTTAAQMLQAAWEGQEIPDPRWRERLITLLKQMAVFGPEAPEYQKGKAFLEKARLTAPDAPFRLLVKLGVFHEDENLYLYQLEVPREFSDAARTSAQHLSAAPPPDPYEHCRVDLRHLETLTIDGERTRDFDDALSLEKLPAGWRLGVHIADVSALVQPDTPLDLEARERGSSIYLPEERLAMLPEEISENALSLLAHQDRSALSFLVTLDAAGQLQDWVIHPSLIRVRRRLTYQEVDEMLPQDATLAALGELTAKLKAQRLAQGGYEIRLPEVWISFAPWGLQVTIENQETTSHQIVSEAMVLANFLAARFLADQGLPAIYRSQTEPREPIDRHEPKNLLKLWQDRRKLSRVVMDLTPHSHWGLGLPCYTLATSPIRRYLDLVTHRQILSVLSGAPPLYNADQLEKILLTIEPAMRRAAFLKGKRLRYWLLKYLAGAVGQKVEALVLDEFNHRYRLLLPNLLLEVSLAAPASVRFNPGDLVQLRLDKVEPREDLVKLSLA